MRDEEELQICVIDESCQSDGEHEICNSRILCHVCGLGTVTTRDDWSVSSDFQSLVDAKRTITITSSEKYPE
jgi:hypothetical protein